MPTISVNGFSGIAPRKGVSLLENNEAQIANNVKLQSGELRPWRKEKLVVAAEAANAASIYKMNGPAGATQWLSWSTDVDVVASPLADTSDFRIYYTGDGAPKKTNWAMATTGVGTHPISYLEMGVPAPNAGPSLSSAGGSGTAETRAYCYTYVSTFGSLKEESAPSPALTVTSNAAGATVTIGGFAAPPVGHYNITHLRIYRAVVGSTSVIYKQVAEIPIAQTSYADSLSVVALGAELQSLYYDEPPSTLSGIVSMANGILAGFSGNSVYFCEPYLPHAWPVAYILNTEFPIVGLGVYGTTLVVCTTKNPYLITGTHPATMSQEKLSMPQACVSKRSIAADQYGMVYASPYGLVSIGPMVNSYNAGLGGRGPHDVVTTPLMTIDEWGPLNPTSMTGIIYGKYYLGFYQNDLGRNAIVLGQEDTPPLTTFDFPATAVHLDRGTGKLYACSAVDNRIYALDGDTTANTTYEWKSKRFVMPKPVSFAAIQANADFDDLTDVAPYLAKLAQVTAANSALWAAATTGHLPLGGEWGQSSGYNTMMWDASDLVPPPAAPDIRSINVVVYADGKQVYAADINSIEPRRLPSGFRAYSWEIIITGNSPVRSVAMATSITELTQV